MACEEWKSVVLILAIYLALATANTLLKMVLNEGMNHLVIVTYRQLASGLFLAPIGYFFEWKDETKMTSIVLCYIFTSALVGGFLSQYLFLVGLQYTTVEFACAFMNITPATTFMMALLLRQETVRLKRQSGRAKVLGSLLCVAGVVLLVLYKGLPLNRSSDSVFNDNNNKNMAAEPKKWVIGAIVLTLSFLCWSSWFLIQGEVSKRCSCKLSITAIWSLLTSAQAAIVCVGFHRDISIWVIEGKLQIFAILFSGIVASGLGYAGMSWCVEQRGPVFTAAFSPFIPIFAGLIDLAILHEQIYLGSILGSTAVISGLYTLLWGKSKDVVEDRGVSKPTESTDLPLCSSSSVP